MPKKTEHPKYGNQQITELIKEYIHNKTDRKMLYLHLVDGETIESIAVIIGVDKKTVWDHLKKGKRELFSHIPYESNGE